MADTLSSFIGQVKIGNNIYPVGSLLYGTCNTAANTAAKVVNSGNLTTDSFTILPTGVTIHVKFTNSNTAENPTLKIGNTDAKSIKKAGTTAIGQTVAASWVAGAVVSFTYDGTNWIMNTGVDTDTTYTAATAAPGKVASDSSQGSSTNYARQDHTHGIDLATGDANGQVKIAGTNVNVKGLDTAAYAKVATSAIADNDTSTDLTTKAQVASYVADKTASLTGAMHFIGTTSTALTDGATTATLTANTTGSLIRTTNFEAGDVVIYNSAEFVWNGSAWELLGDEGSYALKSNTVSVGSASDWSAGTTPTLGTAIPADDITAWDAGSTPTLGDEIAATHISAWSAGTTPTLGTDIPADDITNWTTNTPTAASVSNGTLTITAGSAANLQYTAKSIPNVTSVGTAPSLTKADVSIPNVTDVGSTPSLTYTAKSIPNVTNVGTAPSLTITPTTVVRP